MKKFKFYWLGGKIEYGEGVNMADALNRLGYAADDGWFDLELVKEIKPGQDEE